MNYDAIYLVFYLFNITLTVFVVIGLGKYFCVRFLFDIYDELNDFCDKGLAPFIVIASVISALNWFSIQAHVNTLILLCTVVMVFSLGFLVLFVVIFGTVGLYKRAERFHENLKYKKNMRD